jgi:uncharacterized protein (TIGR03435 family)
MATRLIAGVSLLMASGLVTLAQSLPQPPGPGAPKFEVASIKRNLTDVRGPRRVEPGRFISIGWPLQHVIAAAYGARGLQIIDAPEWTQSDFFDINAKAPDNTPTSQILPMVRTLLADRFKLRAHIEQREMPVYLLAVARADGRLGPGIRRTSANCAQLRTEGKTTTGQQGDFPMCGSRLKAMVLGGTIMLDMAEGGISIPAFIANLSGYTDRFVIDRTGLKGDFDIQLQFEAPGGLPATTPGQSNLPADPAPDTLLSAVQRQLGLRLQAADAPVDVLVIDSVEQPTPD